MIIDVEATAARLPQPLDDSAVTVADDQQPKFEEYLALGIKSAQAGDRVKARTLLTAAADLNPESENAWMWLASISEYPEELLVFLNHVLEINPHNERALSWSRSTKALMAKTLIQRGADASSEGRRELALECFDQAIEYDPRNESAWLWVASLCDDEQRKIELLERVLSINPDNPDAKVAVRAAQEQTRERLLGDARRAAAAGNYAVSQAYLNELLNKFPENEAAWELRSHVVANLGERAAAYEMLIAINPDNSLAKSGLESLKPVLATMAVVDPKEEITEEAPETSLDIEAPPELVSIDDDAILEFSGDALDATIETIDTGDLVLPEEMGPFAEETLTASEEPALEAHQESETQGWEGTSADTSTEEWEASAEKFSDEPQGYEGPETETEGIESPTYFASAPIETVAYADVAAYTEADVFAEARDTSSPWNEFADEVPEVPSAETEVIEDCTTVSVPDYGSTEMSGENTPTEVPGESVADDVVSTQNVETFSSSTILVVDDNPVIRKLISGKLEESGYNVVCAEDGRSAAAIIKKAAPALVLLDITLPKLDGYEVCRNIRMNESTKHVPVIMISGKDGYYEENRGQAAGATGFITKPFGPETLMRTVESHLETSGDRS